MSVKIIDKGWERISKELGLLDGSEVKVGFPKDKVEKSVALVALTNEFGAPSKNIPARPFMAQSFDKNRSKIDRFNEKELSAVLEGKKSVAAAMDKIGSWYVGKVRGTIRSGSFVPNKPATVKRKGSSKPLIDDSIMIGSVDYEVVTS